MEGQPQAGWEFRQLRQWEEQIRESGTPAQRCEDEEVRLAIPSEAAAEIIINTKAGHLSAEGVHHQEAKKILSLQEQQENARMLPPRPDVEKDPRHSKKNERHNKSGFWDGKMWRQNLFNKYADHWNRVHEDKSMEINHSDNASGNSTMQELEEEFASEIGECDGSHVEKASRKEESEQQYLTALRQWAISLTAKKEERSAGPQVQPEVQKKGEERKLEVEKNNSNNAIGASRNHATKGITTLGRQDSQKLSPNSKPSSKHLLEFGPCHLVATIRSTKERDGGEQKIIEDAKVKEGPDKRQEGATEVRKRINVKPSDHRPKEGRSNLNWSDNLLRKQVPTGRARFQGTVIQDKGIILFQECENSKRLEGRKPNNYRAGVPRNVPLKERDRGERILKRGTAKDGGEFSKKSEGLEAKGPSERREINSRPSRKETKRRTEGSQKLCETQDPKGYKSMSFKKGGQNSSLQSESGSRQDKEDKLGRSQQWGQVDWTACDNTKGLMTAAPAPWLQQEKPRNAARAFKETKLRPFLQPQYRTIHRVKDSHCEEVQARSWDSAGMQKSRSTSEVRRERTGIKGEKRLPREIRQTRLQHEVREEI